MTTFEKVIGLKYLKALHLNDSKEGLGSGKDRHESLGTFHHAIDLVSNLFSGKGKIGLSAFRYIMNDSRFYSIPLVLETPISAAKHAKEIDLLYSFVGQNKDSDYANDQELHKKQLALLVEEAKAEAERKKKAKEAKAKEAKAKKDKKKEKEKKSKSKEKKETSTKKKASKKEESSEEEKVTKKKKASKKEESSEDEKVVKVTKKKKASVTTDERPKKKQKVAETKPVKKKETLYID